MAKRRKQSPKRKKPATAPVRFLPRQLVADIQEADKLINRKKWPEALAELRRLDQRHPNRPEILSELINVCYELNDMHFYLLYAQRLFKLTPNDSDLMYGLAGAYMMNGYLFLAHQLYEQFLKRYPSHERIEDVHKAKAILDPEVERIVADFKFSGPDVFELTAEHDRVRAYMEQGGFQEARQAALRFLKKKPDFAPVLNNLSQVEFMEGHFAQAITTARRVLEFEPDNYQALANLTHYLYLTGEIEEARQQAARLKNIITSGLSDSWVKKAEAFTYVGDDQSVLEIFHQADEIEELEPPMQAFLYHLTAVATLRQGDEKQAKKYWQQALKYEPNFSLARENLTDLALPADERHGPWPFEFRRWVSQQAIEDIKQLAVAGQRNSDNALKRATRRYLQQHPEMLVVVPNLLERGDAQGREFAIMLASTTRTPELLAGLKEFALSQHGPAALRHRALQTVTEAGLIPPGPVRMWLNGAWQEIATMNFEIYQEPEGRDYPDEVLDLMQEGYDAISEGRPAEAERIFEQALEIVPNDPTLLNNLAMAYDRMGRKAEAKAMVFRVHEAHPDYFFGIIARANLHTGNGEIEPAEALLLPLMSRGRLHISEFRAMCIAFIQLYLKKDLLEGAQTWLDMWANLEPDYPDLTYWEQQLKFHQLNLKKGLKKLFKRRR